MRERELKQHYGQVFRERDESLPMRERELKRNANLRDLRDNRSLPMRERELKPVSVKKNWLDDCRSPCGSVN